MTLRSVIPIGMRLGCIEHARWLVVASSVTPINDRCVAHCVSDSVTGVVRFEIIGKRSLDRFTQFLE